MRHHQLSRRAVLQRGLLLGVGGWAAALTGCSSLETRPPARTPTTTASPTTTGGGTTANRILLAYFSRPGENYYYGGRRNLEVGNTEVLARMIAELIDCDVYRIAAADPYPTSYDATVARNVREQNTDARPAIADPLASIERYDTVLLGSPIWNVRPPMIMTTFTESYDITGKTVHPFVTHAVSGLGSTERDYTASCPGARIAPGLAVQGEGDPAPRRRRDLAARRRTTHHLNVRLTRGQHEPSCTKQQPHHEHQHRAAAAHDERKRMDKRQLGALEVSAVGLGCMGLSSNYGEPVDADHGMRLIRTAHDLGVTFFDTAEAYGPFANETLVGQALAPIRDQVVLATKFGFGYDGTARTGLDSRPESIIRAVDGSLQRLRTDRIVGHHTDHGYPRHRLAASARSLGRSLNRR